MKLVMTLIVIFSLVYPSYSQPDSLWSRSFGGLYDEKCYSAIQTDDGGFALAGKTNSIGAGDFDFWLVKTDSDGDSLWSRNYGGDSDDVCNSIIQTSDGGFVLAGYTNSYGDSINDFYLIKTDSDGELLWLKTYGGEDYDKCLDIIETSDGGFALAGFTASFGSGRDDAWLLKTDRNGDSLWSRTYGGESSDFFICLVQTSDGGFALGGDTRSFGEHFTDFWLVKTDSVGDSLWSQTGGDGFDNVCNSIIQTEDNGYMLTGYTYIDGQTNSWLVKFDENGGLLSSIPFGGQNREVSKSLIPTVDGGYAFAGYTTSSGAGEKDFWIVKADSTGDSLWSRTFGGGNDDVCYSVIQTPDNGFVLAGATSSFGEHGVNFWLVKCGFPQSVNDGNSANLPDKFTINSIYPNPFNSSTKIRFILPFQTNVTLNIYNINGKKVATLINGDLNPGLHTTSWHPENLASGAYLARLVWETSTTSQKFTMIR
ncbi:MAG: T9SS type A sorting domain-containing protein [Candidatus Electryonea clarkiae]|nr:T9SS type A sorting domain-containing protein [Candidatus Electryonea clarkiae]MDP8288717.1 T9SS type A sorting domain-containing protein [Candidatus Electryonea clarkiae]